MQGVRHQGRNPGLPCGHLPQQLPPTLRPQVQLPALGESPWPCGTCGHAKIGWPEHVESPFYQASLLCYEHMLSRLDYLLGYILAVVCYTSLQLGIDNVCHLSVQLLCGTSQREELYLSSEQEMHQTVHCQSRQRKHSVLNHQPVC